MKNVRGQKKTLFAITTILAIVCMYMSVFAGFTQDTFIFHGSYSGRTDGTSNNESLTKYIYTNDGNDYNGTVVLNNAKMTQDDLHYFVDIDLTLQAPSLTTSNTSTKIGMQSEVSQVTRFRIPSGSVTSAEDGGTRHALPYAESTNKVFLYPTDNSGKINWNVGDISISGKYKGNSNTKRDLEPQNPNDPLLQQKYFGFSNKFETIGSNVTINSYTRVQNDSNNLKVTNFKYLYSEGHDDFHAPTYLLGTEDNITSATNFIHPLEMISGRLIGGHNTATNYYNVSSHSWKINFSDYLFNYFRTKHPDIYNTFTEQEKQTRTVYGFYKDRVRQSGSWWASLETETNVISKKTRTMSQSVASNGNYNNMQDNGRNGDAENTIVSGVYNSNFWEHMKIQPSFGKILSINNLPIRDYRGRLMPYDYNTLNSLVESWTSARNEVQYESPSFNTYWINGRGPYQQHYLESNKMQFNATNYIQNSGYDSGVTYDQTNTKIIQKKYSQNKITRIKTMTPYIYTSEATQDTSVNYYKYNLKYKIIIYKPYTNTFTDGGNTQTIDVGGSDTLIKKYLSLEVPMAKKINYSEYSEDNGWNNSISYYFIDNTYRYEKDASIKNTGSFINLEDKINCSHNWVFRNTGDATFHKVMCTKCEWSRELPHQYLYSYDGISNNLCFCGRINKVKNHYELNDDTTTTIVREYTPGQTIDTTGLYAGTKVGYELLGYDKYEKRITSGEVQASGIDATAPSTTPTFITSDVLIANNVGSYSSNAAGLSTIYKAKWQARTYVAKFIDQPVTVSGNHTTGGNVIMANNYSSARINGDVAYQDTVQYFDVIGNKDAYNNSVDEPGYELIGWAKESTVKNKAPGAGITPDFGINDDLKELDPSKTGFCNLFPIFMCKHSFKVMGVADANNHSLRCTNCSYGVTQPHTHTHEYDGIYNDICEYCDHIKKVNYTFELNDDTNNRITKQYTPGDTFNPTTEGLYAGAKRGYKLQGYQEYEKRFALPEDNTFITFGSGGSGNVTVLAQTNRHNEIYTPLEERFINNVNMYDTTVGGYSKTYKAIWKMIKYKLIISNDAYFVDVNNNIDHHQVVGNTREIDNIAYNEVVRAENIGHTYVNGYQFEGWYVGPAITGNHLVPNIMEDQEIIGDMIIDYINASDEIIFIPIYKTRSYTVHLDDVDIHVPQEPFPPIPHTPNDNIETPSKYVDEYEDVAFWVDTNNNNGIPGHNDNWDDYTLYITYQDVIDYIEQNDIKDADINLIPFFKKKVEIRANNNLIDAHFEKNGTTINSPYVYSDKYDRVLASTEELPIIKSEKNRFNFEYWYNRTYYNVYNNDNQLILPEKYENKTNEWVYKNVPEMHDMLEYSYIKNGVFFTPVLNVLNLIPNSTNESTMYYPLTHINTLRQIKIIIPISDDEKENIVIIIPKDEDGDNSQTGALPVSDVIKKNYGYEEADFWICEENTNGIPTINDNENDWDNLYILYHTYEDIINFIENDPRALDEYHFIPYFKRVVDLETINDVQNGSLYYNGNKYDTYVEKKPYNQITKEGNLPEIRPNGKATFEFENWYSKKYKDEAYLKFEETNERINKELEKDGLFFTPLKKDSMLKSIIDMILNAKIKINDTGTSGGSSNSGDNREDATLTDNAVIPSNGGGGNGGGGGGGRPIPGTKTLNRKVKVDVETEEIEWEKLFENMTYNEIIYKLIDILGKDKNSLLATNLSGLADFLIKYGLLKKDYVVGSGLTLVGLLASLNPIVLLFVAILFGILMFINNKDFGFLLLEDDDDDDEKKKQKDQERKQKE